MEQMGKTTCSSALKESGMERMAASGMEMSLEPWSSVNIREEDSAMQQPAAHKATLSSTGVKH